MNRGNRAWGLLARPSQRQRPSLSSQEDGSRATVRAIREAQRPRQETPRASRVVGVGEEDVATIPTRLPGDYQAEERRRLRSTTTTSTTTSSTSRTTSPTIAAIIQG